MATHTRMTQMQLDSNERIAHQTRAHPYGVLGGADGSLPAPARGA